MDENYKYHKESEAYAQTKLELLHQLERNGTTRKYYLDLVETYMALWINDKLYTDDIAERGVRVPYDNGGGQKGIRKNDSASEQIKNVAQMTKLLEAMGIQPIDQNGDADEL